MAPKSRGRTKKKRNKILLTFDEIQAGFGRTGKLFGYMHYKVKPDIICCGKGSSSSLPLSMVLGSKKILDIPNTGSMSSTHSANPMVCAAGYENLKFSMLDAPWTANSKIQQITWLSLILSLSKKKLDSFSTEMLFMAKKEGTRYGPFAKIF